MTHEEVKEILLSKKWKPTSTFKTFAHSYSLDFEWEDKELFKKVWQYINDNGERRLFFRRFYTYYQIDDHDYWAMHTQDGKGIINRYKIDEKHL